MTEQQYRSIKDRLSYSSIKLFDTDRKAFYQQVILGEPRKEKESSALISGSLVHLLLSIPEQFDEKFHIASAQEPTGQMLELCEALYSRALKSITDGVQTEKFEVLFTDAVNSVKYDYNMKEVKFMGKNMEQIIALFTGTDKKGVTPELWYKEKIDCIGKQMVSVGLIESAEKIVEKIKVHPYTADIANLQSDGEVEVFNELPILFELEGVEYKAMVDKLVVCHDINTIYIYDWKTTWQIDHPQGSYLKYGYYLQAAMYRDAVRMWAKEHDLQHYIIEPMVFVFCDVSGFQAPVKLMLTDDDVDRACRGLLYRGIRYKGLRELQADIAWCLSTGDWGDSLELQKNNGCVPLQLRYGTL